VRTRIGIAASLYWYGIVQLIDVIALISALGAIGGLPALLNALTKYAHMAFGQLQGGSRAPRRHRPAIHHEGQRIFFEAFDAAGARPEGVSAKREY
jgi:hypothetical protein